VVEKPPHSTKVALNKHAATILQDAADHPFTLTTPCFQRCKLRLSEGDRAKKLVTDLGLLESHRVRTGAGRGKTGSALHLTPAGWQWLGKKPPKGTRGGDSIQHAFLIHELARRIPRTTIETLGADLVIAYNTTEHAALRDALQALSAPLIALNTGDLLALEIECSRPEITAPRNVTRNEGFALTIIATLGEVATLQRSMGDRERVVIIDALRLVDLLRA
jgi:hypothetical protein